MTTRKPDQLTSVDEAARRGVGANVRNWTVRRGIDVWWFETEDEANSLAEELTRTGNAQLWPPWLETVFVSKVTARATFHDYFADYAMTPND